MDLNKKKNGGHSGNEISGVKLAHREGKCVDPNHGYFLEPDSDSHLVVSLVPPCSVRWTPSCKLNFFN